MNGMSFCNKGLGKIFSNSVKYIYILYWNISISKIHNFVSTEWTDIEIKVWNYND